MAEHLFELDHKDSAHCVQLSNIYVEAGMWDEVENVVKTKKNERQRDKKYACMQLDRYTFLTGDKSQVVLRISVKFMQTWTQSLGYGQMEAGHVPDPTLCCMIKRM